MEDENVKIFKVRGEHKMSEDDSFKVAKNIALESAEKNLDTEVANFLRENFPNLNDDNVSEISTKFLQKNEPSFIRENLSGDEMICYAELNAEFNLTVLNKFMENFTVFELEKKFYELEKRVAELENILKTSTTSSKTSTKINSDSAVEHYGHGMDYLNSGSYKRAIEEFTQAIKLNSDYSFAYKNRGDCYKALGQNKQAEEDYLQAIYNLNQVTKLNPNAVYAYRWLGECYKALGRNAEAQENFAKAKKLS